MLRGKSKAIQTNKKVDTKVETKNQPDSSYTSTKTLKDHPVSHFRTWAYNNIEGSLPFILYLQSLRNRFLIGPLIDFYFRFSTFCGDKLFYITTIPCMFWLEGELGDAKLGRLFTLHLTLNVYIGNFLKEMFDLPRPFSPPVKRFKHESDAGMPSTHSANAFSLPIYLAYYLSHKGYIQIDMLVCIIMATWTASICLSRIYLGVHSPLDVVSGCMMGFGVTLIFILFGDTIDLFITQHSLVPIFCIVLMLLLVHIHPYSTKSPSYHRSVSIVGLSVGLLLGSWLNSTGSSDILATSLSPYFRNFVENNELKSQRTATRLVMGFSLVNLVYIILQKSLFVILINLFNYNIIFKSFVYTQELLNTLRFPIYGEYIHEETTYYAAQKQSPHKLLRANIEAALIWSKFWALLTISVVLVHTMPVLYKEIGI